MVDIVNDPVDYIKKYNVIDGYTRYLILDCHYTKEYISDYNGYVNLTMTDIAGKYSDNYQDNYIYNTTSELIYKGRAILNGILYARQVHPEFVFVITNTFHIVLYNLKDDKITTKVKIRETLFIPLKGYDIYLHVLSDKIIWTGNVIMYILYLSGCVEYRSCRYGTSSNIGYTYNVGNINYVSLYSGTPNWTFSNPKYNLSYVVSDNFVITMSKQHLISVCKDGTYKELLHLNNPILWYIKITNTGHVIEILQSNKTVETYNINITESELSITSCNQIRNIMGDGYLDFDGKTTWIADTSGNKIVELQRSMHELFTEVTKCQVYRIPITKKMINQIVDILNTNLQDICRMHNSILGIIAKYL